MATATKCLRFVCRALTVLALAGCSTTEPPPPPDEFTVGPEGGTISFLNGAVVLTVPAGAVTQATTFTVTPATSYPQGPTVLTPTVYEVGPSGLTFGQPVSLRVTFTGATPPPGVREIELGVYKVVSGSWELNASSVVDTAANTLTASISSLSVFGILGAPAASLVISPPALTLPVGGTGQLSATVRDQANTVLPNRPVGWSSLEPTVASVNATGLVTGQQDGTARIVGAAESLADTIVATVQPTPAGSGACPAYDAPAVPAPLRTFYVLAGNGNDAADGLTPQTAWNTLTKANGVAQPGDLFLLGGTFTGEYLRPAASGTATNKIVYRAAAPGSVIISGGKDDAALWLDARSHVVVDGVEVTAVPYPLLMKAGASNVWIRNVYIHDTGSGVNIAGSSDNRIEDSRLQRMGSEASNTGDAIFIQDGANRNIIVRNTVGPAGHGTIWVSYQNAGEATADGNIIAHNITSNPWASGMGLNGKATGTIIECNRIFDATHGPPASPNYPRSGIELEGSGNIIRFNEIYSNGAFGITIQGRSFNGFTQNAIGNHIYHNTVFGNGNASIQIVQKDAGVVQNNLIENNIFWQDGGFPFSSQLYAIPVDMYNANSGNVWPPGEIGGNIVRNNIFPAGQQMVLMIRQPAAGGNTSYTLAQAQSAFAGWQANLQADPLFVNPGAGDFQLQAGSPAIDVGVVISGHSFVGAAPDLGARERQ